MCFKVLEERYRQEQELMKTIKKRIQELENTYDPDNIGSFVDMYFYEKSTKSTVPGTT